MAFPLSFCDERGVATHYRWREYPLHVIRGFFPAADHCSDNATSEKMPLVRTKVFCGPSAPYPFAPTADDFEKAVWVWLYR